LGLLLSRARGGRTYWVATGGPKRGVLKQGQRDLNEMEFTAETEY